jgi:hypothetical protein
MRRSLPTVALVASSLLFGVYYWLEVIGHRAWVVESPDHRYALEGWSFFRPAAEKAEGYVRLVDNGGRILRVQAVDDHSQGGGVDRVRWTGGALELCYVFVDLNCVRWPLPSSIN